MYFLGGSVLDPFNKLKEMKCIVIIYELKECTNTELNFSINASIDKSGNPWFKGNKIATFLRYKNSKQAIIDHVDHEDKKTLSFDSRGNKMLPQVYWCTFINESGMYSLLLKSKLEVAKKFQRWVTNKVLPSIRKYGAYSVFNNPKMNTFKIENKYDLHTKGVHFIKKHYPDALLTTGLGELQDTVSKRISSYKIGYQKGQPVLIINNLHKHYNGFCIEFKTPTNKEILSEPQKENLTKYELNKYKFLVSSDYGECIKKIIMYMKNTGIECLYCRNRFRNNTTLNNHLIKFHRLHKIDLNVKYNKHKT